MFIIACWSISITAALKSLWYSIFGILAFSCIDCPPPQVIFDGILDILAITLWNSSSYLYLWFSALFLTPLQQGDGGHCLVTAKSGFQSRFSTRGGDSSLLLGRSGSPGFPLGLHGYFSGWDRWKCLAVAPTLGVLWPLDILVVEKVLPSTRPPLTALQWGGRGGGSLFAAGQRWKSGCPMASRSWISLLPGGHQSPSFLGGLLWHGLGGKIVALHYNPGRGQCRLIFGLCLCE